MKRGWIAIVLGLVGRTTCLWAQGPMTNAPAPPGSAGQPAPGPAAMTDIHDIKPALAIGGSLPHWLWVALGLAVLLALGFYLWWRRRKRSVAEQTPVPAVAPEVRAYQELEALAAESSLEGKVFYFRLSAILRAYLEGRYAIPAAEMTSEELLPAVNPLGWPADLNQDLRIFCRDSDPVKFADASARHERMAKDLAFVRHLVDETRPGQTAPMAGNTQEP
jgi:LPXTG-motif cell wall-anchored protein